MPSGAKDVSIRLQLEADDFPAYQAVLRDSSNRELWHSATLHSSREGQRRVVAFHIPTGKFQGGEYTFDLLGIRSASREIVGSYPLRVVVK
jgi:hypothetical protein